MADPFRVKPTGKSWADIVEEDEQSDLSISQQEEYPSDTKESTEVTDAAPLVDSHAVSTTPSDQQTEIKESCVEQHHQNDTAPQEPAKVEEKPTPTGSKASKWASAPSEPRGQPKWQSSTSSTATSGSTDGLKVGTKASKWADAPETPSRSRYDNNHHGRHDNYSRYGGNDDYHGRNDRYNGLRRNNRWQEDAPSGGRLNRSAFEEDDSRNGGFNNKANFSREKRYQEYHNLTSEETAARDETPEHKKAIESWNAYRPPAEENEDTAKQLVEAASEVEQTVKGDSAKEQESVPTVQQDSSVEKEVSPKAVKSTVSSSPSLKPVSSFSWADDMPEDNSDDDSEYPIPEDWIKPTATTNANTAEVQEPSAAPQDAVNDIKEPTTDNLSAKLDQEATADVWNAPPAEPSQSTWDTDPVDTAPAREATAATVPTEAPKEEKPTYTWGSLDDYKEPVIADTKPNDKEEKETNIAAWNSDKLPEESEENATAATIQNEKPSWNQPNEEQPSWTQSTEQEKPSWGQSTEEQPSWNQSAEVSWNQTTETSWKQSDKEESTASTKVQEQEPKPTYTWGALDDYKEPEVIAKPEVEFVSISKEDEEAAISAWNSIKLPEEPELKEEEPQEPVNNAPSWNSVAQEPEPVKAEPSWNAKSEEPSWDTAAQATSWGAVEQPSWSEPFTTIEPNAQQQQQDWSTSSFQEASSVTSKSSIKDTWKNKLPTVVDDNVGGWKSFAETVAAPPEPVAAPPEPVAAPPEPVAAPPEPVFKKTERGSAASKWKHDRYNGAELLYPKPSQKKPHNLSFKLNDFKEATDNEVHFRLKDIQAQDSPKISIKDDASDRQITGQDIVLRLSDLTAGRPLNSALQQQGPKEVVLSLSELNKGRQGAPAIVSSSQAPVSNVDSSPSSSSEPQDIVYRLSDLGGKDKANGPLDITLKLF
ncbi:hypothetical protein HMPREF1544_03089 [Mucor circinelloides 1006PhL]|uniref:Uncharacterized protein n=1 Tax=Mucor circinelloides f. circinelloides (strain 1006PhL) TaxID=1220926 RepID=S2K453_MUCC1|nr:hypothetical protein HMPREF1544_03089 [Mucor circinelloides 1006PhL]